MEVIPYFLPDSSPAPGAGAAPSHAVDEPPEGCPYFLFVGRLEKIKGVQDILPAFAGDRGPELLVIGTGDYESELRLLAADKPRVRFLGRLPAEEISRYYDGALALIVPSVCYETFGIILIESFRNGTPVIARRIGPFPEIVGRGGGVLFASDGELREAMARIAGDDGYRTQLGREARAAFETFWRDDVVIGAYVDLLRRIALKKGATQLASTLERVQ
jgi:glycosyltransferase involved in cell wall biosynthesis